MRQGSRIDHILLGIRVRDRNPVVRWENPQGFVAQVSNSAVACTQTLIHVATA